MVKMAKMSASEDRQWRKKSFVYMHKGINPK